MEVVSEPDQLLTPDDVSRMLRIGRHKAYQICGEIGVKLGRRVLRVRRSRLDEYITSRERPL